MSPPRRHHAIAIVAAALGLWGCATVSLRSRTGPPGGSTDETIVTGARPAAHALGGVTYNALLRTSAGLPTQAVDLKRTSRLIFFIGARNVASIINDADPSPEVMDDIARKAAKGKAEVPFTIAVRCTFCRNKTPQLRKVSFNTYSMSSSVATWDLIPDQGVKDTGVLEFLIETGGSIRDFRSVRVPLTLASNASPPAQTPAPADGDPGSGPTAACSTSQWIPRGGKADLVIYADNTAGVATFKLEPVDQELKRRIQRYTDYSSGAGREFQTGLMHWSDVDIDLARTYQQLTAVDTNQPNLIGAGSAVLATAPDPQMKPADSAQAVRLLGDIGQKLYGRLISGTRDTNFQAAMAQVEAYGSERQKSGAPLRVEIISASPFAIPWQLLNADPNKDIQQAWGMKFILTAIPYSANYCSFDAPRSSDAMARLLYLKYANTQQGDDVAAIANEFSDVIRSSIAPTQMTVVGSEGEFQRDIGNAPVPGWIVSYSHGHSGLTLIAGSQNTYTVQHDTRGPYLELGPNQFLLSRDIESWGEDWARKHPANLPLLGSRPIVILNGCETGTLGGNPEPDGEPFQIVLIRNGASVVVATEAPVWPYFAYFFGKYLLERSPQGDRMARAVYSARQEMWTKANNPFGLLYNVYGDAL